MQITITSDQKKELNKKFKKEGSTMENINAWLDYEARLLDDELEIVYADFLTKLKMFKKIDNERVKKEFDKI